MYQAQEEYTVNKTGPWTAGPPDGNAFIALSHMIDSSSTIIREAQSQDDDQYLPLDSDATVVAGYRAQRSLLVNALQDKTRSASELLNFNYGAFSNANMRPFSRGTITVTGLPIYVYWMR